MILSTGGWRVAGSVHGQEGACPGGVSAWLGGVRARGGVPHTPPGLILRDTVGQ